jgi:hypothetical protein
MRANGFPDAILPCTVSNWKEAKEKETTLRKGVFSSPIALHPLENE